MFKRHKHTDTTSVVDQPDASLNAPDPSDRYAALRQQLGDILHLDPETLHPDKGRREDA